MRVLVAGGAGFVGSHLTEALLAAGHEVIAVDNLITGRRTNLAHLDKNRRFSFLQHDVCEPLALDIDAVFHLASPASPVAYGRYPLETMRVNSLGTENLLNLADSNGAPFLFTSTSEVYGNALQHPQTETYWGNVNPVGPRSCYDEGKRYAEALIVNFARIRGGDFRIARLFNVYGPRNDPLDGRVVPNLVMQALRDEPLTVYGDGRQTRSLCYVSDAVEALMRLMWSPKASGQIVNVGSDQETSVFALAQTIRELAASAAEIVCLDARDEEIEKRRPSLAKARRLLDWEPRVNLREGLSRTIDWYRAVLAGLDQEVAEELLQAGVR